MPPIRMLLLASALAAPPAALAQDTGTLHPKPLPPLANPDDPKVPAKELFGRATSGAPLAARAIGSYAKGCVAGATALPVDGETWQVMRLSRNRNWGHPRLIGFLERLAEAACPQINGWPGLLVGDTRQPRGGPMLTGHASHQIGLDADIWLTPMPDRRLSRDRARGDVGDEPRAPDRLDVDPLAWTPAHLALLKSRRRGSPRWRASSSTRRSRRRSAATPAPTAPG